MTHRPCLGARILVRSYVRRYIKAIFHELGDWIEENAERTSNLLLFSIIYSEDYMVQYSCHFFCGQSEKFPKPRTMPWLKHMNLRKREFVLCKVESVEILFPSQRSLNLMKMYGESTNVTQTPQLVQRLTLSIV